MNNAFLGISFIITCLFDPFWFFRNCHLGLLGKGSVYTFVKSVKSTVTPIETFKLNFSFKIGIRSIVTVGSHSSFISDLLINNTFRYLYPFNI